MSALIRAIPCADFGPQRVKARRVENARPSSAGKRDQREKRFPLIANPWGLSGMELAALAKLLDGSTPKDVASAMCIAYKTHQTYLDRARIKMNAASTLHACLLLDRWMRGTKPQDFEVVVRVVNGQPSTTVREITQEIAA